MPRTFKPLRRVHVAVHVRLNDLNFLPSLFGGKFFQRLADLFARAAPFGPRNQRQRGYVGLFHFGVECCASVTANGAIAVLLARLR